MPKLLNHALTAHQVKSLNVPGVYSDGNGLTLRVDDSGNKRWFQRITVAGQKHNVGLGRYPVIGLADARNIALENLLVVKKGRDILADKRAARAECKRQSGVPTFREAADKVIELRRPTWSNNKHAAQWISSLHHSAAPLGCRKVSEITTAAILEVLEPLMVSAPITASRTRQRLEHVFNWAITSGHRTDNPAGKHILSALPMPTRETNHHESLAYADVPAAYATVGLANASESTKGALRFLILTAARITEATGVAWDEIDWESKVWTVPAARMKARKEHSVPLSTGALDVLNEAWRRTGGQGLVFPGQKGKQISNRTIQLLLQRLEIKSVPHGFRSSIRDWTIEQTNADWTLGETVLAHRLGSSVESAYARTNMLEQRRELMQQWSDFISC